MGERKKLTMYYPPDFDPRLVPKMKKDWDNFVCEVRMMLPFTVQCDTCGEFMYMGTKFNSKKENAQGERYKGIQIIRFNLKCTTCGSNMTFKTDPANDDYAMESGGSRTFEAWKEKNAAEEKSLRDRLEEDKLDPMKALENRTLDSKMEMDVLDALDELKAINERKERVDTAAVLQSTAALRAQQQAASAETLDAEDEAALAMFQRVRGDQGSRLEQDEDERRENERLLEALDGKSSGKRCGKPGGKLGKKKAKAGKQKAGKPKHTAQAEATASAPASASGGGGNAADAAASSPVLADGTRSATELLLHGLAQMKKPRPQQQRQTDASGGATPAIVPKIKAKRKREAGATAGDKPKREKTAAATGADRPRNDQRAVAGANHGGGNNGTVGGAAAAASTSLSGLLGYGDSGSGSD